MPNFIGRTIPCLITATLIAATATAAWAASSDEEMGTSTANEQAANRGTLATETAGLKPELGILQFHDANSQNATRGAIGVHYDMNFSNLLSQYGASRFYLGPTLGATYSHIGAPGANFFGSSPSTNVGTAGGNVLIFPLEGKVGYDLTDNLRISAHGGGDVLYRSIANSMIIDSHQSSNSRWTIYPAVGGDVEFGVAKNVAIDLRPDVMLTPINTVFQAMVGIGIALG